MSDNILDFVNKRKQTIEEKRRAFERLMFQNLLGVYSVIDQDGIIYPVSLIDISHSGCLFQVPWTPGRDQAIENGSELDLRIYFTKKSYIPAIVNIRYHQEYVDKSGRVYMRYGCEFDQSISSFEALKHFIMFLYKFAEHSVIDQGDIKHFFL